MGLTVTEKILRKACGHELHQGEIVNVPVGTIMSIDIAAANVSEILDQMGVKKIKNPDRVVLVNDHCGVGNNLEDSTFLQNQRDFAKKFNIPNLYEIGRLGICHQVMVEDGWVKPGSVSVGADSHAITYGAVGAFGSCVSETETAVAMATGSVWMRVPESIRIEITGELPFGCSGKDVALKLMSILGYEVVAPYKALEFYGEGIRCLSIDDRMTICNMMCEAGAKNAVMPIDEITVAFTGGKVEEFSDLLPDGDAVYEDEYTVNLDDLEPLIAAPHKPSNVKTVRELEGLPITQGFVGSCTSGRLSEIAEVAAILKGRELPKDMIMLMVPASWKIQKKALELGYIQTLIEAGVSVESPSCAACGGTMVGVLPPGAVCVSSSSRNFKGRMGSADAEIYLASAATVAASALMGKITDPRKVLQMEV